MNKKKITWIVIISAILLLAVSLGVALNVRRVSGEVSGTEFTLYSEELVLEVGSSIQLLVEGDMNNLTYSSSNESIAAVDENGIVTGVKKGITFVTIKSGQYEGVCKVTVNESEYAVVLGYSQLTLVKGSRKEFEAKLMAKGAEYEGRVTWSVSETDEKKCTLKPEKNKAMFHAKEVGTYTVKAVSDEAEGVCVIRVISDNAKRADSPKLSVKHCDTLSWKVVNGCKKYSLKIGTQDWITVEGTTHNISDFVEAEQLKNGESLTIGIKTEVGDNYNLFDSYISTISVMHDYEEDEVKPATCFEEGVMVYTCAECDRTYTDEHYLEPHEWKDGVCTKCHSERTEGILYEFDDNYIPILTSAEAQDPNSAWRKKYAPYYKGLSESEVKEPRFLWKAVQENRDKIPAKDRLTCYYVKGSSATDATEIYVRASYDDGVHGKGKVVYAAYGVFQNHENLKKLVLPESIVEIRGQLVWGCDNLETVVMPGMTYLPRIDVEGYRSHNFNDCYNLKALVVGDGFRDEGRHFFAESRRFIENDDYAGDAVVYVLGDGTKKAAIKINFRADSQILNGDIYYQCSPDKIECGKWYYSDEYEVAVRHHKYVGRYCKYCGAGNSYGIVYGYNPGDEYTNNKPCYYVAPQQKYEGEEVTILAQYDDGIHGTLPVRYLARGAFAYNHNIKKVTLPRTVTELRGSAFEQCFNLETVIMPGVTQLRTLNNYMGGDELKWGINNFLDCNSLTTLIVGDGFRIQGQQFLPWEKDYSGVTVLYVEGSTRVSIEFPEKNGGLNEQIYYYSEDGDCGTWKYDEDGNVYVKYPEHKYVKDICKQCGSFNDYGVTYLYTSGDQYTDNQPCYFVAPGQVYKKETVTIRSEYNDGKHGVLPVRYLARGAFTNNNNIKKVILPETVTDLRGMVFENCKKLETVIMPGVTKLRYLHQYKGADGYTWSINNFLDCISLKTVVVGDGFRIDGQQFVKHQAAYENVTSLYVYGTSRVSIEFPEKNLGLSGKNYYYSKNDECGTWRYDKKGNVYVKYPEHKYVNDICKQCGSFNDYGITYLYTSGDQYTDNQPCYFVAPGQTYSGKTVTIRSEYNDGKHGVLPVRYLARGAFYSNNNIKKVILPETVTDLRGMVFENCKNLETVIMPGVTKLRYLNQYKGADGYTWSINNFLDCISLKTVVVGDGFRIEGQQFVKHQAAYENVTSLYVYGTSRVSIEFPEKNLGLSGKNYYYSENDECGTWKYDKEGNVYVKYPEHKYVNDICKQCGSFNDYGITYQYSSGDTYTDDQPCYYVVPGQTYSGKTVTIRSEYNDGKHGVLPVRYLARGAFAGNTNIKKVILPETVTDLRGMAFESCSNLETVIMPGVKVLRYLNQYQGADGYKWGTNNFLDCPSLTTLVVGDGFKVNGQQFYPHAKKYSAVTNLYIFGKNKGAVSDPDKNKGLSGNVYCYSENDDCGTWKYDKNGNVYAKRTGHEYVNTICKHCGAYDTHKIEYAYDEEKKCYYVASNTGYKEKTVTILSKYNDGTHGEAAVTYVTNSAFFNNDNITKVVLPESVTEVKGSAFEECSNLEILIMPGVKVLESGNGSGNNKFNMCTNLTTVVVGDGCKITGGQFKHSDTTKTGYTYLYVYGTTPASFDSNNPTINSKIYYYNETGSCGTWKYNGTRDDVLVGSPEHRYDSHNKCEVCHEYNTQGVEYSYDAVKDCYYVKSDGAVAQQQGTGGKTIHILPYYDDGTNGEKEVTYIGKAAFEYNYEISKVVLPSTVTELQGDVFSTCLYLETVIMPEVRSVATGTNNFLFCRRLKTLVVGDGFAVIGQQFQIDKNQVQYADLYVNGTIAPSISNLDNNKGLSGKVYYYDENGGCGKWKYNDTQDDVVGFDHEYAEGYCPKCGAYDTRGIVYAYDETANCYYVADNSSYDQEIVIILSKYNDGTNGEAAVTYITNSAFNGNKKIKKVIMPTSVTEVKGAAFELCSNLETVIMPGVTVIETANNSGNNKFNACPKLTKVVVGDGCKITGGQFKGTTGTVYLYVYGTTPATFDANNPSLNSTIYYYDETGICGKWKYNDTQDDVILNLEHNYVDGKCERCNVYNTQGIVYAYDDTADCYYVANNSSYDQEIVTILSKYNDGTHGEAAVTYIAKSAFSGNKKIKKVIMPTSVTEVKGSAFELCSNLETVIMPGVTVMETANGSGNNKFNGCSSLTKVVVGDGCKITGGQFKGTTGTVYLYVYGTTTATFDSNNPSLNQTIYYYDANGASGTWKYSASGEIELS